MSGQRRKDVRYSATLDRMAAAIRRYHTESGLSAEERMRTQHAVRDFCLGYPEEFRRAFAQQSGVQPTASGAADQRLSDELDFTRALIVGQREHVFLLRDAYAAYESFQSLSDRGFPILANREYICADEDEYFALVDLVYRAAEGASDASALVAQYRRCYATLINERPRMADVGRALCAYIEAHASSRHIVLTDIGLQHTLSLFCAASVHFFGRNNITCDVYAYSVYPWLRNVLKGTFFSDANEHVSMLEDVGAGRFRMRVGDAAAGALAGFAVGDALGFPVAGLPDEDAQLLFPTGLSGFEANAAHPYFRELRPGQYTSNTVAMRLTAERIAGDRGVDCDALSEQYAEWGLSVARAQDSGRWVGPTTATALRALNEGVSWRKAGSTTTASCAGLYRAIPIGIYHRPFARQDGDAIQSAIDACSITHNTEVCHTGAAVCALVVGDLIHGVSALRAVRAAARVALTRWGHSELLDLIQNAAAMAQDTDEVTARRRFGTGSPVVQTLPLAIYMFLRFRSEFTPAVLAAANSYRTDDTDERARLAAFSWEQQILEAIGGNTDGIAALTGAFAGAQSGASSIPTSLRGVEDWDELLKVAAALI